eukprot:Skav213890  [mRNA]  locus=scaffold245:160251:161745:- [translate_table: standard]
MRSLLLPALLFTVVAAYRGHQDVDEVKNSTKPGKGEKRCCVASVPDSEWWVTKARDFTYAPLTKDFHTCCSKSVQGIPVDYHARRWRCGELRQGVDGDWSWGEYKPKG